MIQAYMATPKAVMPQLHKAGDKLFVDYAGRKIHIVDGNGALIPVEVFVAILGCSQYIYVEASPSQQKRHFIASCQNALHYYGGVPDAIVTDNLKSAVTKVSRYEPGINEDFAAFADHYGVAVSPTGDYRPKDKALVENAVRVVYAKIYQHIKEMTFTSIEELNRAIATLLYQMNTALFSGKDHSRKVLFDTVESKVLGKRNPTPFEIKRRMMVTVMRNYHIRLSEDSNYYSVTFEYIGKKVRLIYDDNNVEIFYRYELIARHKRSMVPYQYTTDRAHQPSEHRFLSERSHSYFISKAEQIDPVVAGYIARVLESKSYYEQGYKACRGILSFARKLNNDRLIDACRFADNPGKYNYTIIEEILAKDLDLIPKEGVCNDIPTHNNIRGNEYYQ